VVFLCRTISLNRLSVLGSRTHCLLRSGSGRSLQHVPLRLNSISATSDDDGAWPRRAQPDASRDEDSNKAVDGSWDDIAPTRNEADIDRAKESFFFQLASLGFGAVLVGERVSGKGFVNALGRPTGIPLYELDIGLAFVVLCLFVGGLVPTRFVYKSINDKPNSILEDIPQLVGRISCLGLGATIAAEAITGKGILGLLSVQTGTDTLSEIEFAAVFVVLFFITNLKSLTSD